MKNHLRLFPHAGHLGLTPLLHVVGLRQLNLQASQLLALLQELGVPRRYLLLQRFRVLHGFLQRSHSIFFFFFLDWSTSLPKALKISPETLDFFFFFFFFNRSLKRGLCTSGGVQVRLVWQQQTTSVSCNL